MRTRQFITFAMLAMTLTSCMKHAGDYVPGYGDAINTWSFTDGKNYYYGNFATGAVLHTTPQSNNTYTLEMTGAERATGEILTLAISLTDPIIHVDSYRSGINGSDHATSFYYSGSAASRDAIYASTNTNPGAVIEFTVLHYDADKHFATIAFSGQAYDATGKLVNISKGKLTTQIEFK